MDTQQALVTKVREHYKDILWRVRDDMFNSRETLKKSMDDFRKWADGPQTNDSVAIWDKLGVLVDPAKSRPVTLEHLHDLDWFWPPYKSLWDTDVPGLISKYDASPPSQPDLPENLLEKIENLKADVKTYEGKCEQFGKLSKGKSVSKDDRNCSKIEKKKRYKELLDGAKTELSKAEKDFANYKESREVIHERIFYFNRRLRDVLEEVRL
ncbi:hypothetical protein P154DRAFT_540709 [Amniculicola lignicola CBS 123094]|uniref:Uncharacterized protein n=1 Tax=Amniculicola lignicola CBS 123094 TaxID=1392246 RepID=A0A6A5VWN9_9PLEO|nr:hypothetical protein P154DRAFT_540709 [Amniculicola lignicola CBS 123094]